MDFWSIKFNRLMRKKKLLTEALKQFTYLSEESKKRLADDLEKTENNIDRHLEKRARYER